MLLDNGATRRTSAFELLLDEEKQKQLQVSNDLLTR
jgi:hypothetical protein